MNWFNFAVFMMPIAFWAMIVSFDVYWFVTTHKSLYLVLAAYGIVISGGYLWFNLVFNRSQRLWRSQTRSSKLPNPRPLLSPSPPQSRQPNRSLQPHPVEFESQSENPSPRERKVTEPVIGYRCWRVNKAELTGVVQRSKIWLPQQTSAAVCIAHERKAIRDPSHHAPREDCTCGFYGYYWEQDSTFNSNAAEMSDGELVYGAFLAWGRIIRHGFGGFRAEFVRPLALMASSNVLDRFRDRDEALAVRYKIPRIGYANLKVYASDFGVEIQPKDG